jgi:hypothetical protein
LVMFSDLDATGIENPLSGNDRFVIYEDGGRPLDVQLASDWRPSCAVVLCIAKQLVEVLAYLFAKKVVHRKLQLGSVVLNRDTNDIKLISLGDAKYIEPLDYERTISEFKREWLGVPRASSPGTQRPATPPPNPTTDLSLNRTSSMSCAHPSLRFGATTKRPLAACVFHRAHSR